MTEQLQPPNPEALQRSLPSIRTLQDCYALWQTLRLVLAISQNV